MRNNQENVGQENVDQENVDGEVRNNPFRDDLARMGQCTGMASFWTCALTCAVGTLSTAGGFSKASGIATVCVAGTCCGIGLAGNAALLTGICVRRICLDDPQARALYQENVREDMGNCIRLVSEFSAGAIQPLIGRMAGIFNRASATQYAEVSPNPNSISTEQTLSLSEVYPKGDQYKAALFIASNQEDLNKIIANEEPKNSTSVEITLTRDKALDLGIDLKNAESKSSDKSNETSVILDNTSFYEVLAKIEKPNVQDALKAQSMERG